MGTGLVLQVCGMKMPAAGNAASASSVKACMISEASAAAHGHIQGAAAECVSWNQVRRRRACLPPVQNPYRPQLERYRRTYLLSPCAGSSPTTTTCKGVAPDQNGASSAPFSSSVMETTLLRLRNAGIIACLRTTSADVALDAARAALDGGLTVVEVTMTTPSAATVIESLVREYPSATIGAGTVLSEHEAEMAKEAGAKFLTSPVTVEEMVRAHRAGPVLFIPGAMTPTEVASAYNMGARAVKLFPTALVGDIRFVVALRKTLGHIPLIPSSGISLDMVELYFSAGVMAVIVSDAVFDKSALESRDFSRIRTLASSAALKSRSRNMSPNS